MYPIMATKAAPMMKGARNLQRFDTYAVDMVTMKARTYGGTVSS